MKNDADSNEINSYNSASSTVGKKSLEAIYRPRGVPRNLKRGCNIKLSVFHPKSSEEKKKGHHALRLSVIRILPLQHESFVQLSVCVCGGGYAPEALAVVGIR